MDVNAFPNSRMMFAMELRMAAWEPVIRSNFFCLIFILDVILFLSEMNVRRKTVKMTELAHLDLEFVVYVSD